MEVTLSLSVVDTDAGRPPLGGRRAAHHGRDTLLCVFLRSDEPGGPEVAANLSVGREEVHCVVMRRNTNLLVTFTDESDLRQSRNAVMSGRYIVPGTGLVVEADPGGLVPLGPGSRTRLPASGSERNYVPVASVPS